ncbi:MULTISPECIES: hypothetical protein [Paracoccus]|uniref:Uncharacterized protein n=1 Tax=Paracoccus thiocyanatus TaxID=34006 RepID=A0A1N7A2S2_9RHOB|nr:MULTISPECIES: hypothetical protein [Paracoccus]SIR33351.1 hypothetical protein SAMN05421641_14110 [Paracoccus thiocyanatus]
MQKTLIIAAALSALSIPALAAPNETPYALSAVHADFQAELERTARLPGEVGAAAGAAAELMAPHNAAQERLVLPLLGWADAVASGREAKLPDIPDRTRIDAVLSQLYDRDVDLVTALVELYAAADEAGDAETARLAERMIWHQTSDLEVLYPAALFVETAMRSATTDD